MYMYTYPVRRRIAAARQPASFLAPSPERIQGPHRETPPPKVRFNTFIKFALRCISSVLCAFCKLLHLVLNQNKLYSQHVPGFSGGIFHDPARSRLFEITAGALQSKVPL